MLSSSSRTAIGPALALAGFVAIAVPRLVVAALVIAGLAALLLLALRGRSGLREMVATPVAIALGVLSAYMALTSLWALNALAALEKGAAVLTLSVFALASAALMDSYEREVARLAGRWFLGGLLAGLCWLTLEYAFGLPVTEFLAGQSSELADSLAKHEHTVGGHIEVATYVLNKNITIMALFFVPALLLTNVFAGRRRTAARMALFLLTAVCVSLTESGTAIGAIIAGISILGLGCVSLRATRWFIVGAWVVSMVLALPLGALPVKVGATEWPFLPRSSVQARFYIWSFTAEKALERPLTGIGVRATRELQPDVSREEAYTDAYRYQARPGRHAHNGFLQVWLEMGAIGAALLLLLGLAGLRAIGRLNESEGRYGYALFASMCVVAAFGFGIWQTWLIAGLACAVLLYMLGVRIAREDAVAD